jgi:hypothetical protein
MDFTSSCTEETAASVVSTGVAVTSVTGAATVVVAVVVAPVVVAPVVAFLEDFVVLAVSVATGVATTGVAATGVAGVVFLETVLDLGAEAFIILEAVELFMAGIRTIKKCLESIFDPTFIFGRVQIFLSTSS